MKIRSCIALLVKRKSTCPIDTSNQGDSNVTERRRAFNASRESSAGIKRDLLTEMNRQVVPLERLTQVTLPHENITFVSGPAGLDFSRPPSLHESLYKHVRLTHGCDLQPAHATIFRRVDAVPAVRVTAAGGHRLAEGTFAQRTRKGSSVDPPSGGRSRAGHVVQERGRQVLQPLGRHRRCGQAPRVDPNGVPGATTLGQGVAVAEQHLVVGALLLQAVPFVHLGRQVVVSRGERLLGKIRHRVVLRSPVARVTLRRRANGIVSPSRSSHSLALVKCHPVHAAESARRQSRDVRNGAHLTENLTGGNHTSDALQSRKPADHLRRELQAPAISIVTLDPPSLSGISPMIQQRAGVHPAAAAAAGASSKRRTRRV